MYLRKVSLLGPVPGEGRFPQMTHDCGLGAVRHWLAPCFTRGVRRPVACGRRDNTQRIGAEQPA